MKKDDSNGSNLAAELEQIQAKLAKIAAEQGDDASPIKAKLMDLAKQTDRLSSQLEEKEAPPKEVTDAKTILVVDDNEDFRGIIDATFARTDYKVLIAASSEAALALFKASEKVHLVMTDIFLPGMNGPTLVQQLRELEPGIKVIFMSGYVEENIVSQEVENVMSSGATFLQKPFALTDLLETVDRELAKS
jgi:two-component system, cell cycle sensor histidine kinase and response regulator CckA